MGFSQRGKLSGVIVGIVVVAGYLGSGGTGASAAAAFNDSALIRGSSVVSPGVTGANWELFCPTTPSNQGEDGHVFTLPDGFSADGTTTSVTGSSAAAYDLDLHFYRANCSYAASSATVAKDEVAPTPAGTKWILVHAFSGSNNTATLTVATTSSSPSPTASATATVTPSPSATSSSPPPVSCGTYPVAPSDPLFPSQNVILGGQWGMRKIGTPQAWQVPGATGCGIKVAVLDTGLDLDHPDFQCPRKIEVIPDSDWIGDGSGPEDGEGHGTHVAGIVGACTNNGTGVVGVAPDATVMPVQVLDAAGDGVITETLPGAIRAATDAGAHVINMSLGTLEVNVAIDLLFGDVFPVVEDAVAYAVSKGVVVVAAAGNASFPMCSYPALIQDIVCVGSSDSRDINSWFGNFPVKDDDEEVLGSGLLAPGGTGQVFCDFHAENILSTYLVEEDNCDEGFLGYRGLDGTSMASPHVAGVAALVYERLGGARSSANGAVVVEALLGSTDDLYAPGYDPASGYGRLNALKAVQSVAGASPSPSPSSSPQVQNTSVTFTSSVPSSGQFTDSVTLSARLTDDGGTPLGDEQLTFQLLGHDGFRETGATTDATGHATVTLGLDAPPGAYEIIVAYSGKTATYNSSTERRPFSIAKEDAAGTLRVEGSGSKRTLIAALSDLDDASRPIESVLVSFYANGEYIGDRITNHEGVATLPVPPGHRSGKTTYKMIFAGTAFFEGATAQV